MELLGLFCEVVMYCKDCKYWHKEQEYGGKSWMTCGAVEVFVEREDDIGEAGFALYASAWDDSGLDAGMKTGPLFGCVKFEQKKPNA